LGSPNDGDPTDAPLPRPVGRDRVESEDGHELRFAVNYLSHFYLTRTLLPLMSESASARIVSITSTAQQAIDFDDVSSPCSSRR